MVELRRTELLHFTKAYKLKALVLIVKNEPSNRYLLFSDDKIFLAHLKLRLALLYNV